MSKTELKHWTNGECCFSLFVYIIIVSLENYNKNRTKINTQHLRPADIRYYILRSSWFELKQMSESRHAFPSSRVHVLYVRWCIVIMKSLHFHYRFNCSRIYMHGYVAVFFRVQILILVQRIRINNKLNERLFAYAMRFWWTQNP